MCTPVAKVLLAGDAVSSALYVTAKTTKALINKVTPDVPTAPDPSDATKPPAPTPVTPPPVSVAKQTPKQASRAPDVTALRKANSGVASGYNASSASTLLTGPSGVDLSKLSLGRNTLLGY